MAIAHAEKPSRRSYEAPSVQELSPEETIAILSGLASEGDEGAGQILQRWLAANPRLAT